MSLVQKTCASFYILLFFTVIMMAVSSVGCGVNPEMRGFGGLTIMGGEPGTPPETSDNTPNDPPPTTPPQDPPPGPGTPPPDLPPPSNDPTVYESHCLDLFFSHGANRVIVLGNHRHVNVTVDRDTAIFIAGTMNRVHLTVTGGAEAAVNRLCIFGVGNHNDITGQVNADIRGLIYATVGCKPEGEFHVASGKHIDELRGLLVGNHGKLEIEGVPTALCNSVRTVGHDNEVECHP